MSPRKAAVEKPTVEMTDVELNLFCDLTDAELSSKGQRLAEAITDVRRLDTQRKDAAAALKGRIETLQGEIRDLVKIVSDKKEKRIVKCRVEVLGDQRFIYRSDTGELVEITEVDLADRQLVLPLGK